MADHESLDDFRRWKVDPLKKFCRDRGNSVAKKRKEELVALAYAFTIQNAPVIASKEQDKETVSTVLLNVLVFYQITSLSERSFDMLMRYFMGHGYAGIQMSLHASMEAHCSFTGLFEKC
ncbi:hypothetical protein CAPTEDRAFT_195190 [Capitella teleta]|uniref:Uncharacterized protein n=1 Tax=Capitella teleta TaxID=283909 RepID=R7U6Z9_CAPTE|nr:hypothetical protein CAPTEDRAFT_195190 [Capitella teleta]|eukprot:ELU01759.1 hypothetical protein CAPTEDRAFT_195190 [Capitella teleta]